MSSREERARGREEESKMEMADRAFCGRSVRHGSLLVEGVNERGGGLGDGYFAGKDVRGGDAGFVVEEDIVGVVDGDPGGGDERGGIEVGGFLEEDDVGGWAGRRAGGGTVAGDGTEIAAPAVVAHGQGMEGLVRHEKGDEVHAGGADFEADGGVAQRVEDGGAKFFVGAFEHADALAIFVHGRGAGPAFENEDAFGLGDDPVGDDGVGVELEALVKGGVVGDLADEVNFGVVTRGGVGGDRGAGEERSEQAEEKEGGKAGENEEGGRFHAREDSG